MRKNQDVVQTVIKIIIPKNKWLSIFNLKYPELRIKILSNVLIEESIGNVLFEMQGPEIKRFLIDLQDFVKNSQYQVLFESSDHLILNIKINDPWILNALIKTQMLIPYPIVVEEGSVLIETITLRVKIDEFLSELEKNKIRYIIKKIGYFKSSPMLTKKQYKVLKLAFEKGYFKIPRLISLKELAGLIRISTSALSEMMRRINGRLVKQFLAN